MHPDFVSERLLLGSGRLRLVHADDADDAPGRYPGPHDQLAPVVFAGGWR